MKRILTAAFAAMLVLCLGASALAASDAAVPEKREPSERHIEMMQKFEEMQTKFKALSMAEKKEIYAIHDEIVKLQISLFDRYTKTGIMTTEEAAAIRNKIEEANRQNKEEGLMPGTHQRKPKQ